MRADVLTLVARKLQSSPAVEGKLPKDGLETRTETPYWEEGFGQ